MIEIFYPTRQLNYGVVINSNIDYIRRMINREIETVKEYYASRIFTVASNHLLVRLLMTLDTPVEKDVYDYLDTIDSRVNYVSKYFRLTSPIEKGKLHKSIFYGNNSKEIILTGNSDWVISDVMKNWKKYSSITVLKTPIEDLNLLLPKDYYDFHQEELSIFYIDIRLLALQYKLWYDSLDLVEDAAAVTSKFIHQFVLPGMVSSQTDYVIFNRLKNLYSGYDHEKAPKKHPFPILDYGKKIDRILYETLQRCIDKRMRYEEMMQNMPGINNVNLLHSLSIPKLPNTRQVRWAIFLSRAEVMETLINIGGKDALKINRHLINALQINVKMLERDNIFENMLTDNLASELNFILNRFKNL